MGAEVQNGDIAVISSRFKWRIEKISKLNKMHFSDTFLIGCHRWQFLIYPKGASDNYLSIYLCAVGFTSFPYADFTLGVVNQIDYRNTIRKGAHYQFTAQDRARDFTSLMPLNELNDPFKGYIVNDICIVEAEVSMPRVAEYQIPRSLEVHTGNSVEVEQSVGVVAEVVTPTEDIHSVVAPTKRSELIGVVEAVAEVTGSSAAKQDKFPGAGRLYEEGKHPAGVVEGEKFEDIGGFSVLKTQASLYKEIWLNYGHIASSQVLTDLNSSQVAVVTEIMTSIEDMNRCHLEDVSSELIDLWEKKIKVAEKLEFNIVWLREHLEEIKKNFAGDKKLHDTLMEQVQAKAQVIEAEQQLVLANDRLNMAKERLFALETKISPLLMERQNFLKKCGGRLLLFDCRTSSSRVMPPVQKDAIPIEESIDNNNSKTVLSTGIAASIPRRTRTQTTSISPAYEAKRKSSGDSAAGVIGHHSEKKSKTSKDGSAATSQSITDSPMPSRGSLSPEITATPNANQLFTEDEILAVLLQQHKLTTRDLVAKFRSRLNTEQEKLAFSDIMRSICKIQTKENGTRYVVLIKK